MTDEEETTFWGFFREQRLADFIEELAAMHPENAQNMVDLDALTEGFWSDPDFWAELEDQWLDEIDVMLRSFPPAVDNTPEPEIMCDLQNSSG